MIPFFSIGVPTYNRHDLLKQTLSSIIKQTFTNFEVMVGNDYTQEPLSAELLGIEDPRIRFLNYPQNLGELKNMNTLLGMAHGRYFTWQFDDDLHTPDFLEAVQSALDRFNFPLCAFTSFRGIYGTSFPKVVEHSSKQSQLFSGRQFLRRYLSGRLKAMGCIGVYDREYLRSIGGVERLANGPIALHSEYLLLVRAGLLEEVAYIDAPLILYRDHKSSWSSTNTEADLFKQAGKNLVRKSVEVFTRPELIDDFQQNLTSILKLSLSAVVGKIVGRDGHLNEHELMEYLFSITEQFSSLKGTVLYKIALDSLTQAGKGMIWQVAKARFKLVAPYSLIKFARRVRSFVSQCEDRAFWR
jgi:glycosyltransferase involved in cell wall biosynthesis